MASVKNPLMSVEAAGTVAGITFSKTRSGYVAKRKPIPSRSIIGIRPSIRSTLGFLSRQWGELTDAQRQSWRDWAETHPGIDKFGDPFIMSGINAYIMLNSQTIRLFGYGLQNDLPPADPPASASGVLTAVSGATDPGDIDLTWTEAGTGIAADKWEVQLAGPFQSKGRVEVGSRFAFNSKVNGNILTDTLTGLDELFWYWIRVRYVAADGQVTAWVYDQETPKVTP